MLSIESTKNLTGVTISGSYANLNKLYDAFTNVLGTPNCYPAYETCSLRIYGFCYDIRHAYQGDRHVDKGRYDEEIYSFECLWPELIFIWSILDNFIELSSGSRSYLLEENEDPRFYEPKLYKMKLERIPDDIAILRYFQNLIKNAFLRTVDEKHGKRIVDLQEEKKFSKKYRKNVYIDYCTQWIDILNVRYINRKPDKRKRYLVTIAEKILFSDEEYYYLNDFLLDYHERAGVPVHTIELVDMQYPPTIEW